jgi:uncharacterized membrane protein
MLDSVKVARGARVEKAPLRYADGAMTVLLVGYLAALLIVKLAYRSKSLLTSDIALYMNMLWNTDFSGGFLRSEWLRDSHRSASFLAEHFSPTLVLLAPFYQLAPSSVTLLVIQSLSPVIAALILYRAGCKVLNDHWLSALCASVFLFHPSTLFAAVDRFYGFHHDCLLPPLLALAFSAVIDRRLWLYVSSIVLVLGVKENMVFVGLVAGPLLALRRETRVFGWASLAATAVFGVVGFTVLPQLVGHGNRHAMNVATHVVALTHAPTLALAAKSFGLWLGVVLSFGAALFRPALLLLVAPDIAMMALTGIFPQGWHAFPVTALLACATVLGMRKVMRRSTWLRALLFAQAAVVAACGLILIGFYVRKDLRIGPRLEQDELSHVDAIVPSTASVGVTSDLLVHFANRTELHWPGYTKADYVVINTRKPWRFDYDREYAETMRSLAATGAYAVRYAKEEGLVVYGPAATPDGRR